MASLIETNKYLRDPVLRKKMLRDSTLDSSVFEGAKGLMADDQRRARKRRSIAAAKKRAKG